MSTVSMCIGLRCFVKRGRIIRSIDSNLRFAKSSSVNKIYFKSTDAAADRASSRWRVRIKEVADYCETDIVNTYRVWLRYELFRGKITPIQFQFSEQKLGESIKARSNTKPHLDGMIEMINLPK